MSKWTIAVNAARQTVKNARGQFDDLDGIETKIRDSGEAMATSALEPDINSALDNAYNNFLRPMSVTMVLAGRQLFDNTDSTINIYDLADLDMGEKADDATVAAMQHQLDTSDDTPDYSASTRTKEQVAAVQAPADPKHPGKNTNGDYIW